MDIRSFSKRFIDSFVEEIGRWSARLCAAGFTFAIGLLTAYLMR